MPGLRLLNAAKSRWNRNPLEWYGDSARQIVRLAFMEATLLQQDYVGAEHLLLGVIRADSEHVTPVLRRTGAVDDDTLTRLRHRVRAADKAPPSTRQPRALTPRANRVLRRTVHESRLRGAEQADDGDVFKALIEHRSGVLDKLLVDLSDAGASA